MGWYNALTRYTNNVAIVKFVTLLTEFTKLRTIISQKYIKSATLFASDVCIYVAGITLRQYLDSNIDIQDLLLDVDVIVVAI